MSQAISSLALGSSVWVADNGTNWLYTVAGFDVHGADTVTLVRSVGQSNTNFATTANSLYDGSLLDTTMQAYESRYSELHRALMLTVDIVCATGTSTSVTLSRRVFALSYTEVGFGNNNSIAENSALGWYASNENRANGSAYWLRSWYSSTNARHIAADGTASNSTVNTASRGVLPAHVISSATLVADTATSGGYEIEYPDPTPEAATIVSPDTEYIQIDAANTFEWEHNIATGRDPSRSDLEYSYNGGAWTTLATVIGASTTTTIAADTLPAGNIRWRVRTYNADGVAGEWSDAVGFVGVGSPAAPIITEVTQCSRPVVNWSSLGQIAYRVQIGDYDTKEVQGTAKTFKLPYYIPNGEYTVKVAIRNASGEWSDWVEYTLTLSVTGPTTPTLTGTATAVAASLSFSSDAEKLYVLRDGTPIADVTGLTSYADYSVLGTASYVIRAVDESDNYTDSAAASVTVSVPYATIAAVDAMSQYKTLMLTRGAPRSLSGSISQVVTYKRYAGRSKPVAVFSGQEDEAYQASVSFLTKTDADAFIALIRRRKTMIYRDSFGNRWFVVIGSTGNNQDFISQDLTLTLTVVDYTEEIEYAGV